MAEKPNGKRNGKTSSRDLREFSGRWLKRAFGPLTPLQLFVGFGFCLLITLLLMGYQFQSIPDYKVGDVADRTIEAPHDSPVEDPDATREKREKILALVPAVFNVDLRVNQRIESELRGDFARARDIVAQERELAGVRPGRPLTREQRARLLATLREQLPELNQNRVLEICLNHDFSSELEDQVVKVLAESMRYPGVVESRNLLLRYVDRGIVLRNEVTGRDERLSDWMAVRGLAQARDALRQNQFELTAVEGDEKRQLIGFFETWVRPNVSFSEEQTRIREQTALAEVDPVIIQVKKGRTLVRAGDEITKQNQILLRAFQREKQPFRLLSRFFGILIVVGFFMSALWHYLAAFQRKHHKVPHHYVLLALILAVNLLVAKVFVGMADVLAQTPLLSDAIKNPLNFYFLAPVAFGAVLVILLIDTPTAILFSLIFAVFIGMLTGQVSVSIYSLAGCLTSVYVLDHYRERLAVVRAGLMIGLVNSLVILALYLYASATSIGWVGLTVRLAGGLLSGLFASVLASLLLPVLESLFDITTDIRLLELSNLNKPILRRLAVEAPGTYHHSIVVGTLAEAAAEAIDANALLVRVGAYYHDIGKLKKPAYYVENQIYSPNKHERLTPNMSSLILASHVKDGLSIADEIGLTPKVKDLIPQHHGTRLMTYFYQKARDAADGKQPNVGEEEFRYPGPKPQSKEAAILMLADQVEAAARTLQEPSPGQIEGMIRRLTQAAIQDGQFDECDITLRELEDISHAFARVIVGIHHHRIEYPGFDFNAPIEEKRSEHQRVQ
jgi:putative nucleotidyltransferase with HDIG domain